MTDITVDLEEFYRLKELAGESVDSDHPFLPHVCAWVSVGGANVGCHPLCSCSIPVLQCIICGDCDYGDNAEAKETIANCTDREELEYQDSLESHAVPLDNEDEDDA